MFFLLLRTRACKPSSAIGWLWLLLFSLGAQNVFSAAGTVEVVVGTAHVIQTHGAQRPAIRNGEFYEGETLVTSANSNLKLRMLDDAIIWLRPESRLKIDKYRSKGHGSPSDDARLTLLSGMLREVTGSIGKSNHGDYRLATPNATIGIRGTEFDAAFITPSMAGQLNVQAGTYNRVYAGSTVMTGSNGQVIVLQINQAGFIGLVPNQPPQLLPSPPPFLTQLQPSTPAAPLSSPQSRRLQLSIRFGEGANATSQQTALTEGVGSVVTLGSAAGRASTSADGLSMEVVSNVKGNTATIEFRSTTKSLGSSGMANEGPSVVSIPMGSWTDISGQGPWRSGGSVLGSKKNDTAAQRVFMRIDEISR